jgi:tetratricopeptide (TPR) repeat protein
MEPPSSPPDEAGARSLVRESLDLLMGDEPVAALEALARPALDNPDGTLLPTAAALVTAGETSAARAALDLLIEAGHTSVPAFLLRADVLLELGADDAAAADVREAARLAPGWASLWLQLGDLLYQRGEHEEAVEAYDHTLTLTDRPDIWQKRGAALSGWGRVDEARRSYERALAGEPDLVSAYVGLAETALGGGGDDRLDEALRFAAEALARDPASAQAYAIRGEAYRLGDRYEEAAEALTESIRLDPDFAYAVGTRAQVRRAQDRLDEAIDDFEKAAELAPEIGWIRAEAGEAYYARLQTPGADAAGDAERALAHLTVAARIKPTDGVVWSLLGQAHWWREDLEAAEEALWRAHELVPDEVNVLVDLARIRNQRGAPAEALGLAEQACEAAPDDAYARLTRGQIRYAQGDVAESVEDLEVAVERLPGFAEARAALGESYRQVGRYEDALHQLQAAVVSDPVDAWALSSRGAVYVALGRVEEALPDLRRALELRSPDTFALTWLREALSASRTPDEAADEIGAHARRYPDNLDIQEVYADALRFAGRYREAVDLIDEALWREPEHVGLLRSLGWAHLGLGDKAKGLDAMKRAAAVSSEPATLADLAYLQSQCGQTAEALETVDRGLATRRTASLLVTRSQLLSSIAEWAPAVAAAREAVAMPPPELNAHLALGWALEHLDGGQITDALAVYRDALGIAPDDPYARRGVADMLWSQGKAGEAAPEYERSITQSRRLADAQPERQRDIGWCLYRLGRYEEAADAYLRGLSTGTDRIGILFDIGLNWLAAGDQVRAADAYDQGFALHSAPRPARDRGTLEVAARDLREALRCGQIPAGAEVDELLRRLLAEAAAIEIKASLKSL